MPLLNWQALKEEQVAGTIFNELDDDSVLDVRELKHKSSNNLAII